MKKSESNQIKVKCTIHALSQMYCVGFRAKIQFYRKLPGAIGGEINCNNHHNYSATECNLSYWKSIRLFFGVFLFSSLISLPHFTFSAHGLSLCIFGGRNNYMATVDARKKNCVKDNCINSFLARKRPDFLLLQLLLLLFLSSF